MENLDPVESKSPQVAGAHEDVTFFDVLREATKAGPIKGTRLLIKSRFFGQLLLFYFAAVVLSAGVEFWVERRDKKAIQDTKIVVEQHKNTESLEKLLAAYQERLTRLEHLASPNKDDIVGLRADLAKLDIEALKNFPTNYKELKSSSVKATGIETDLLNLRKAINPSDPTTILAVPRLQDKFEDLGRTLQSLRTDLNDVKASIPLEVAKSEAHFKSETDRVVDMVKWLLLLVIPLIFTTLKDVFKKDKSSEERSPVIPIRPPRANR